MRYVLHVGPTKTGSSAIQAFLSQNRAALASVGACYGPGLSQSYLRKANVEDHREIVQQLKRGAEEVRATTIILSGETLSNMKPKQAAALIDLITQYGGGSLFSVVYYARNVADRLMSRAAQRLKSNPRLSDEQLFQELAGTASPTEQLRAMEIGFGAENVIVRSYEDAACLEADFCLAANVPWTSDFRIPSRSNTSLDPIAGRLFGLLAQEYGDPLIFKRAADISQGRQRLPATERHYLELILPLIQAADLSHPKLAPWEATLAAVSWPHDQDRPALSAYANYLIRLLQRAI